MGPAFHRSKRCACWIITIVLSVLIGAALEPVAAGSGTRTSSLSVFAASSLAAPFTELGRLLASSHPGLRVRFNFAGSQQLALQIEQGAAADVFAPADGRWIARLRERGWVDGEARNFAKNRLTVIVPARNPARIAGLQDLARPRIRLVFGAPSVPVGDYSRRMLQRLRGAPGFATDYDRKVLANVVSEEDNAASIVAKVALGEADAGVVYRSDVTPQVARRVRVFEVPDAFNVEAAYSVAVLKNTQHAESARAFVALLVSPRGQETLRRHGLIPVVTQADGGR